jgi:hypothetical protein
MTRWLTQRRRFWFESGLSVMAASLAVLTLMLPNWIEAVSTYDPDHGDGMVEAVIVVVLALVAAVASVLARWEWRTAGRRADGYGTRANGLL